MLEELVVSHAPRSLWHHLHLARLVLADPAATDQLTAIIDRIVLGVSEGSLTMPEKDSLRPGFDLPLSRLRHLFPAETLEQLDARPTHKDQLPEPLKAQL